MQRLSPGRARDHPVMEKFLIKLSLSLSLSLSSFLKFSESKFKGSNNYSKFVTGTARPGRRGGGVTVSA